LLILVFSSLIFLGFKISHLTFRFGDGNEYVYMASLLWKGILPYRDYFFVDPPGLILLLSIFHFFYYKAPILFQLVPVILEIFNVAMLFLYLKKTNNLFYFFAPILYLFSFTVLSTSDYITGVQLVICFSWLAILFGEYKKYFTSGICWGLALCTKLYAIPLIVGWLISVYFQNKQDKKRVIVSLLGLSAVCTVILLPFVLIDFTHLFSYIVLFHFNRTLGIDKGLIYRFFFQHEWLLIIGSFIGIWFGKKKLLVLPFLFIIFFFLLFPDLYYLYLDILIAFLVYFLLEAILIIWNKKKLNKEFIGVIVIICYLFLLFNWFDYSTNFASKGRFSNAVKIADAVKILPGNYPIYGSYEVVPLVALLSNRLIINNYIDTNPQGFSSFGQNKAVISEQVVKNGAYIIGRIRKEKDEIKGFEGYFDIVLFKKYCSVVQLFPSTSGEDDTHIGIFLCKE